MQVSFVCSEHSIKSRSADDRLSRQNASSPNLGTRSKFRAVAVVARSLGQLSVQNAPSSSESSVKQPGMKYRYGEDSAFHSAEREFLGLFLNESRM
uniref:Uncharacterized protein n=1 Tax=Gopherus evgoodei TaxID=1825980 RepID=A0A8C5F133_9SAUR